MAHSFSPTFFYVAGECTGKQIVIYIRTLVSRSVCARRPTWGCLLFGFHIHFSAWSTCNTRVTLYYLSTPPLQANHKHCLVLICQCIILKVKKGPKGLLQSCIKSSGVENLLSTRYLLYIVIKFCFRPKPTQLQY